MHELSLAQSLVEQIQSAAAAENAVRVLRIVVEIGPYAGVETVAFEFAFPFAAEDTLAADAELVVEEVPAMVECDACRATSRCEPTRLICPACGSDRVEIRGGHEFLIRAIELEIA